MASLRQPRRASASSPFLILPSFRPQGLGASEPYLATSLLTSLPLLLPHNDDQVLVVIRATSPLPQCLDCVYQDLKGSSSVLTARTAATSDNLRRLEEGGQAGPLPEDRVPAPVGPWGWKVLGGVESSPLPARAPAVPLLGNLGPFGMDSPSPGSQPKDISQGPAV